MSESPSTSSYPASLDTWVSLTDKEDLAEVSDINKLKNAIEAVQTELGTDPAGSKTDLVARLAIALADSGALAQGTSNPGSPVEGQIFFRTDTNVLQVYDGSTWLEYAETGTGGSYFQPDGTVIIALDNATNGIDLSVNHNAITLTSLAFADLVAGKVSARCYSFDGSADYLDITKPSSFTSFSQITMEAWINTDSVAAGIKYIFDAPTAGNQPQIYIDGANIYMDFETSSGDEEGNGAHGMSIDTWYHMVFVWDNSTTGKIYINGILKATGNDSGNGVFTPNTSIRVGASATATNFWNGEIDGIKIYNYRMTESEILARYNSFK